ncbi:MAG TPA: amino acid--tRNA ligase-related protein, partial [Candidatus Dormibacteraeota bacterium]
MTWRDVRCGQLTGAHAGGAVTLAGWVRDLRDDGATVTIELRDGTGVATLVVDRRERAELATMAASVTRESVVQACGRVAVEGEPTVRLESLRVLSAAGPLPFRPDDPAVPHDDFGPDSPRLRQRWLHLRSEHAQRVLRLRSRIASEIRRAMEDQDFLEVETPLLHKPMPVGGNDFLVASRVTPGELFGLPQSPQFYKELLGIGGVDRYYQIARAFRDEPVGQHRIHELTQFDLEMAFATRDDVFGVVETALARVWRRCLGVDLTVPFRRVTWREARERYGTDRPDLRYGLEIAEAPEHGAWGVVAERPLPAGEAGLEAVARAPGVTAMGLAASDTSGALQVTDPDLAGAAARLLGGRLAATAVIARGEPAAVAETLGRARTWLAGRLGLAAGGPCFAWVVDFPLFVWSEEWRCFVCEHNPFTAPTPETAHLLDSDPGAAVGQSYDLVCDGIELGGGALRIESAAEQAKVFDVMGLSEDDRRFWLAPYLDALETGAPPRGGIAVGLDRLLMLALGAADIR